MASNAEQSTSQSSRASTSSDHGSDGKSISSAGALDPASLPQAIKARKSEYTRERTLCVKVGTWNVAAIPGTEEDVGEWFVNRKGICEQITGLRIQDPQDSAEERDRDSDHAGQTRIKGSATYLPPFQPDAVGLYVLGLQEIVDVSSPAETLRPYVDPTPSNKWKAAIQKALPTGYKLVSESQLVGLMLLIYAAPSVFDSISSVSSANVGTGLLGYMGNKGAVATRLMLGETTCLVFINCHLSAGSDKGSLERRNWDATQIITRTKFDPIDPEKGLRESPTESIGEEDFAFWFGDLNYRLEDIPGDDVRQVLSRHTENEYDKKHPGSHEESESSATSSPPSVADEDQKTENRQKFPMVSDDEADPHTDPSSLQTTISSLLPHDQLRMQQDKQKAFHEGWREGEISFLPTYKYDVGSVARFDSSEKHRGPSWCDRILYRTRRGQLRYEKSMREAEESKKRDEEMKARGLDQAAAEDNVLFDYDPEVDGADSGDEYNPSKDGSSDSASLSSRSDLDDSIRLEYYVSHQGILTSDHKPIAAGFTIKYDSVDPHLKAKVHQEVVRELDKTENELRPGLTVVVDTYGEDPAISRRDPNAIHFGDVAFDVTITRSLTVANTSSVPATFNFEKPDCDERQKTPSWLDYQVETPAHPEEDKKRQSRECTLHPGELANIDVTAHVQDIQHVRQLNERLVSLEDILVLRVTGGRDHFISVYGRWLPTCFGRSVEELIRMPEEGARSLVNLEPPGSLKDRDVRMSAPRELFQLTETISELSERAIAEWSMIKGDSEEEPPWARKQGAGWPFDPETWTLKDKEERCPLLALVREAMDTNQPLRSIFPPEVSSLHRLEVLSETLLVFLRSLSDGIVTASVWEKMNQQILSREKSKAPPISWEESQAWVLESLASSPAHSVSFSFITFMLAHIANEVAPASATAPPESSKRQSDERKQENVQPSKDAQQSNPSPAKTAASISAGNFRHKPHSSKTRIDKTNTRRQAVEETLSSIFASVLIISEAPVPSKDKERRALEDRKRSIIEPFLKTTGVDEHGPSGGAS